MGRHRGPFTVERGQVVVRLADHERDLLAHLMDDVGDLLEPEPTTAPTAAPGAGQWDLFEAAMAAPPPQDPAVARLLPPGHREDPELAESFRRLSEQGLRERKRTALATAAGALRREGRTALDREESMALLKALADVRLVVAERLGIRTEQDGERLAALTAQANRLPELSPQLQSQVSMALIYDALSWWQESLVGVLPDLR